MGKEWRDCIVTLIDLIDVKKLSQSGLGSQTMLNFHELIARNIRDLPSIAHAYAWNDSVLLLSYVDQPNASFEAPMRDADKLKRQVDKLSTSYAIAVKGQTFPHIQRDARKLKIPALTIIRASSWAMANCFQIEGYLGPALKRPWYVDGWIKSRIRTKQQFQKRKVPLFPSKQARTVYVFDGYLWGN